MASKAAEVLPMAAFFSTSSTMTPFLYQTRTLVSLHWTRSRSIVQPQLREARRHICSTMARQVRFVPGKAITTTTNPEGEKSGPTIRRTTIMRDAVPQFSGEFYGNNTGSRSVTEQPQADLSTMRDAYVPWQTQRVTNRPWHTTELMDNDVEDFESSEPYNTADDLFGHENDNDAWTRRSNPSRDRQTTITLSERTAFEAIFNTIRNRTESVQRYGDLDEDLGDPTSPEDRQDALNSLERIMGGAVTQGQRWTRAEKEILINRYPPSLRALAAQAVGLDYNESHFEETAKREEEALDNDQLEELREPLREKVEAKMHAAETDAELWAVMESEVFPLIEKLGLKKLGAEETSQERPLGRKPSITSKASKSKVTLPPDEQQTLQFEPIEHQGQVVSPLAIYGPLYPSYLLLGLRLLDRSFAKPSSLTLSILPKIKSLGLISHVLGASTQLYNELLIIHWYRYDDFRGALSLLSEMEESGLNFNKETLEIVNDIAMMQGRTLRGDRGPALKALWSLPEFAPGKFGRWRTKITRMLHETMDITPRPSGY